MARTPRIRLYGNTYDDTELVVPRVMLREPRLLVPRMQPLGLVSINKTHSIAKGLSFYVLSNLAGNNIIDLISGKFGTPVGTTIKKIASSMGLVIWNNGTDTDYFTFSSRPKINCSNGYSIVALLKSYSSGAAYDNGLFVVNSGPEIKFTNSSGKAEINLDEGWPRQLNTPITDANTWHTYAFTQDNKINTDETGVVKAYRDAVVVSTTGGRLYTTSSLTIGTYLKGSNFSLNGEIAYCGVWNRELSVNELFCLTNDPYQFLIPA